MDAETLIFVLAVIGWIDLAGGADGHYRTSATGLPRKHKSGLQSNYCGAVLMFILPAMKMLLLAVCFAVVWGFISTGQVSLAIAVICIVIISLLKA